MRYALHEAGVGESKEALLMSPASSPASSERFTDRGLTHDEATLKLVDTMVSAGDRAGQSVGPELQRHEAEGGGRCDN
jgi:hypothetical protein